MSISFDTKETYDDVPTGGSGARGFIGQVKVIHGFRCGWNKEEEKEIDGVKYGKGPVFYTGTDPDAAKSLAEEFGSKYANRVLLVTIPIASITNMNEDARGRWTSPAKVSDVRISPLSNKDNGVGLNFITLPSMVDAYARMKGWYEKPLFDTSVFSSVAKDNIAVEDASGVIETLVSMRKAIWAALGEPDYTKTLGKDGNGTKSERLREALSTYAHPWSAWVRTADVPDPSPKAFYWGDPKGDEEGNGDGKVGRRNRVPVIIEFFAGEKAAQDAGAKELEGKDAPVGATVSVESLNALFTKLSALAKKSYDAATWESIVGAVLGEVEGVGGKDATKPKMIKIAKDYELDVADVELVKALIK